MSYMCAECRLTGCKFRDMSKTMTVCPCKNEEIQTKSAALYQEEENYRIAHAAGKTEAEGYCQLSSSARRPATRSWVLCSAWVCTTKPGRSARS